MITLNLGYGTSKIRIKKTFWNFKGIYVVEVFITIMNGYIGLGNLQ